ncbi:hypothetical protein [Saccharothrix syringae]|uniref:Uncharacterized protein n=1 Tax=Saccharothrix syringae TaxID=103733 RepID=A0A5Q0GXE4_SACSY|nr:hypothetical protein [Saccharothrix syringae]QFZ18012.1 hypothetical protein EKG83_11425 [Saccharothrix syringae]
MKPGDRSPARTPRASTSREAHARVTQLAERIRDFMAAGAADTAYSAADAQSMVTIWNTCAWTLQLVDDTKPWRPRQFITANDCDKGFTR